MTFEEATVKSERMRKEMPFNEFLHIVKEKFFSLMKEYDKEELEDYFNNSTDDIKEDYLSISSPETLMSNYGDINAFKKKSTFSTVVNSLEMCF